MKTLQIATFGTDGQDAIAFGIKNFPIHKLILICFHEDKNKLSLIYSISILISFFNFSKGRGFSKNLSILSSENLS